jgi:Spy/CpxP family protein refolding chaperone
MYTKTLSLLLIFSLAFNIAFVGIWLHNRSALEPAAPSPPGAELWSALGATPEQRRVLETDWTRLRQEARACDAELRVQRNLLLDLMAVDPPDEAAVRRAQERVADVQVRMQRLFVDHLQRAREVLTPEQRRGLIRMLRIRGEQQSRRFRRNRLRERTRGVWRGPAPAPPAGATPTASSGEPLQNGEES